MRRMKVFALVVAVALLALPVATQMEEGNIARIIFFHAKPGMNQQLEDGLKKHMAWHKAQQGTWAWYVWSVVSGEGTGSYGAGTFGHRWADFDTPDISEAADVGDAQQNILPYVAEGGQWRFYALLPKVSRPRPQELGTAAMEEIWSFRLRGGTEEEFLNAIAKAHQAILQTNWPVHYEWYTLVNGGEHPEFVLVLPKENWAAMAPPEKPFPKMLEEAFGRAEAEAVLKVFDKTIKSQTSEIIRTRADLSYIPVPGGK
ncbi:MAG: hypothetical protein HY653_07260 [Acidobacteria bacterium]|nr:hypothetical protein [Acidobacteriota bacterium]